MSSKQNGIKRRRSSSNILASASMAMEKVDSKVVAMEENEALEWINSHLKQNRDQIIATKRQLQAGLMKPRTVGNNIPKIGEGNSRIRHLSQGLMEHCLMMFEQSFTKEVLNKLKQVDKAVILK
eukprot:888850-Amphidinium_carterae.1